MKKIFFLMLICATQNILAQNFTKIISDSADLINDKVINWRHIIHQNPELSNREFKTAEMIANHLRSLGIIVKSGVGKTGVVGILVGGKPGPVVALRADMDALPVTERTPGPYASKVKAMYNGKETGVMHACGHDTHVAILMGVAEILNSMKKDLKGTVKFIFQPAEEGAPEGEEGGAALMIKEGVMDDPKVDVVFGLHIKADLEVGKIAYRPGGFMASAAGLKIVVKGRGSHGAKPWNGIDPILVSAQIINNLQSIVSRNVNITENPAIVTIGSIHGGNRGNIIPEEVEMMGTVRALSDKDQKLIIERIKTITQNTAQAYGATATVQVPWGTDYPVTKNDSALTAQVLPSLQKAAGTANVNLEVAETGAEDFSFFEQKVPGLYFNIGGMPKGNDPATAPQHHTADFNVSDEALKTGLKALSILVVDYLKMGK